MVGWNNLCTPDDDDDDDNDDGGRHQSQRWGDSAAWRLCGGFVERGNTPALVTADDGEDSDDGDDDDEEEEEVDDDREADDDDDDKEAKHGNSPGTWRVWHFWTRDLLGASPGTAMIIFRIV